MSKKEDHQLDTTVLEIFNFQNKFVEDFTLLNNEILLISKKKLV